MDFARLFKVQPHIAYRLTRWLVTFGLFAFGAQSIVAGQTLPRLCDGVWLGVSLELSPDGPGARVNRVESAGPGADAGLGVGDVITAIGGIRVDSPADLANWAADAEPGERAVVSIFRKAQSIAVEISPWAVPKSVCLTRLGEYYVRQGDTVAAEHHFRTAVAVDPAQLVARQRLSEMASIPPRQPVSETASQEADRDRRTREADIQPSPGEVNAGSVAEQSPVRADGMKAMVAVGGFDVKAAKAVGAIGDGLREMLVSALHQSGYFVVVDREDLQGVLAEQDLSRSVLARGGSSLPETIEVADIMIFGAVTEFEPQAGGSSFMTPMMGVPLAMGARISWSQMALDVRVVDVRSGRVLGAERVPGMARFAQATIAGALPVGGAAIPTSLSVYRNTPMEYAIRDCIRKAGYFVINSIGDEYYRHR